MSVGLSNDEIEDKYFLQGRVEILSILNELAHRREPVSVYFNNGQQFILSILLSARDDGLVFDMGGDEKENRALSNANNCTFLTYPDGIKVQFSGTNPQRFLWGNEEAFWVDIPTHVIRLQRRESYRITLPLSHPISAQLIQHDSKKLASWSIYNLSVGGFCVLVNSAPSLKVNDIIQCAQIQLSNNHLLECPVIVRHISKKIHLSSEKIQIGFSFVELPHAMDVAIQRTIIQVEYERHKLMAK